MAASLGYNRDAEADPVGGNILEVPVFAMRLPLLLILLVGLLSMSPQGAVGQSDSTAPGSLMVVRGVAVDATAETAVAARELALADGQRRAFELALKRIVLREDYGRLPQLDADSLADLVEALEIADEKTSAVRYLAKLTVRFKEDRVRTLLRVNQIPYTETRSKPVLLLPVLERAGALSLFEDGNLWRAAWNTLELPTDALLPVVLPLGDLEDVTVLGSESAVAGELGPLQALGERYRSDSVVVLHAIVSPDLTAASANKVDVLRHWYGREAANVVVSSYRGAADEALPALLQRVALAELAELEEAWKRQTLQTFGESAVLSVRVPLAGLEDWLGVRSRLERIGMVRRFELRSISRAAAQVVLHVSGDPARLDVSLQQQDLNLVQVDGFWELRPRNPARSAGTGDAREDATQ